MLESKGLNLKLPLALVLNYPALDFNFTSWMSKDHLKVLRAEDTSGLLSSGGRIDDMRVPEHEDYMHFNTLSMVGSDGREGRRGRSRSLSTAAGMRRNQSWIATLKEFTVGDRSDGQHSPTIGGSNSPRRLRLRRSTPSLKCPNGGAVTATQQTLGLTALVPKLKPNRTVRRSKTLPENQSRVTVTGHDGNSPKNAEGDQQIHTGSSAGSAVSHIHFPDTRSGNLSGGEEGNPEASIGHGRLTMTSRTGYFQDRTIPPSMVGFPRRFVGSYHMKLSSLTVRGSDARDGYLIPLEQESGFQHRLPRVADYGSERCTGAIPEGSDALRGERSLCGRHHHLRGAVTRVQKGPSAGTVYKDGRRGVFGDRNG